MNVRKSEEELISVLNEDGKRGIVLLYKAFKQGFLSFARRYTERSDLLIEAYHEGVIGFYEIFKSGRYNPAQAGIKTLVTQIGKNHLINRLKKDQRDKERELEMTGQQTASTEGSHRPSVEKMMEQLGSKCKTLLTYFYFHNYSIDAIMNRMEYKNENVVKSHKSRCLKQLKSIMQEAKQLSDG